jgi:type IV pilus assembly protein PilE
MDARQGRAGFTLVELMIVVVIVAVLAMVAYPSYLNSVRKGRRADAVKGLTAIQQAQERWRANNTQYATLMTGAPNGIDPPPASVNYTFSIDLADASNYVTTAQAVAGTTQAADTNCTTMRLQIANGNIFYGGCHGCAAPVLPATVSDPNRCWAR